MGGSPGEPPYKCRPGWVANAIGQNRSLMEHSGKVQENYPTNWFDGNCTEILAGRRPGARRGPQRIGGRPRPEDPRRDPIEPQACWGSKGGRQRSVGFLTVLGVLRSDHRRCPGARIMLSGSRSLGATGGKIRTRGKRKALRHFGSRPIQVFFALPARPRKGWEEHWPVEILTGRGSLPCKGGCDLR